MWGMNKKKYKKEELIGTTNNSCKGYTNYS